MKKGEIEKDISRKYRLNIRQSKDALKAALVIARRAFTKYERVPKLLKDKLLTEEERIKFDKENNWKQWSIISKRIKEKGGESSGLWQESRKRILGIA